MSAKKSDSKEKLKFAQAHPKSSPSSNSPLKTHAPNALPPSKQKNGKHSESNCRL